MAATLHGSRANPKTRLQSSTLLSDFVGNGKEFDVSEVPTWRAVIQRGILIKEKLLIEKEVAKQDVHLRDIVKELVPLILIQWHKSNAKFFSPVVIQEKSLVTKVERMWQRVDNVVRGRVSQAEKAKVESLLDNLLDITTCRHLILLCEESGDCPGKEVCQTRAHIKCSCPKESKIPVMELRWLYGQRTKKGEKSSMMFGSVDREESARQQRAAKRKNDDKQAELKRKKKQEIEHSRLMEQQEQVNLFLVEEDQDVEQRNIFSTNAMKEEQDDVGWLVDALLEQRLGQEAYLVKRYLDRPKPKNNSMLVLNTAMASLRCGVSPTTAATIATAFLKDIIATGHLPPEMSYLACDRSKLVRARKKAMAEAKHQDENKYKGVKIVGMGYDGRRDTHTRSMLPDKFGKLRLRFIKEEHISVTEEPNGKYIAHFVPDSPTDHEKPALKIAQALYYILEQHNSINSLQVLQGDSTNQNTGWKGGTHAHLEKLLGRKLFWAICSLHTNELPLRHLIAVIDGPTISNRGFMGPVCSLLSKVNEMEYDPDFRGMPGGEELIEIPGKVLDDMSTDQKMSYQLVKAVKAGELPPRLQGIQCGPLCHARWLTTGQRIIFMWTRRHGLTGQDLRVREMLVKFCLEWYFKLYFDIKVKHLIVDTPYHILTSLRILKTQPKKARDVVTCCIRTGAWYAHPECILLSLLASHDRQERKFVVDQILKTQR